MNLTLEPFGTEKQPKRERLEMNVNVGKTVPSRSVFTLDTLCVKIALILATHNGELSYLRRNPRGSNGKYRLLLGSGLEYSFRDGFYLALSESISYQANAWS